MPIGDVITVTRGPFAGFTGVVMRELGDRIELQLQIFGRATTITLEPDDLRPEDTSMAGLEAQVAAAVRKRGFAQREMLFWEDAARRDPVPPFAELATEVAAVTANIARDQQAATASVIATLRTTFHDLDERERANRWLAERSTWLEWRSAADAVADAHYERDFADLDDDERRAQRLQRSEAGFALRKQFETWQRRHALDMVVEPELRNEAMERELEQDPRNDAVLVYADWLQGNGNPRGELIALGCAPDREAQVDVVRARLMPQLLGPLVGYADDIVEGWRWGAYFDALKVAANRDEEDAGVDVGKLLALALALPSARFLRSLSIDCASVHEDTVDVGAVLRAAGPRPTLRSLAFDTDEEEEMLSWTSAGEVALHALYPNLEELTVNAGRYSLTAPEYPHLRRLILRTCSIDMATLQSIIAAEWPALEELELWFGSHAYGIELAAADLVPLLSTSFPRLRSLALSNGEDTDALCALIVDSPLLPQLESLAIAKSTMTDAGAEHLIAAAAKLSHLDTLDVDENYLSDAGLGALRRAVPTTLSTRQRQPDAYEGTLHYYAAVGE